MMKLTDKQLQALKSQARYKVWNFGRRSGKTTALAHEALKTGHAIPNSKITYYAQTFGDARDIAWNIFLDVFGNLVIKKNETLLEITISTHDGKTSKVTLKGWESVVTSEKGRGTENDLLLLDEVAFLRGFKHYWEYVLEPTLLTTKGRVVFSSTPNGFNDFYDLATHAQANNEWDYVHATSYDNPHNDKKWLDDHKKSLPEDTFAQEYLADFRKQQGLVFKEFARNIHVYKEKIAETVSRMAGIDPGFVNPAGVLTIERDKRGVYYASEEFYETGKTDAKLAEYVAAQGFEKVYPDPENAGFIQELRERRVNVYEVNKGKGSIVKGIDRVRELFLQGRLKIHAQCINLIWEIETYHYPDKAIKGDEEELPVHENCHLIDALRYVLLMNTDKVEIRHYNSWIRNQAQKKQKVNPGL